MRNVTFSAQINGVTIPTGDWTDIYGWTTQRNCMYHSFHNVESALYLLMDLPTSIITESTEKVHLMKRKEICFMLIKFLRKG
jgi:hypothetical protein